MLIFILIVLLLVVLYWSYASMGKDITSPAFLFIAPFTIACICAGAYSNKWSLCLHFNTFIILFGSCLEFALICWLIYKSVGCKLRKKIQKTSKIIPSKIHVHTHKILLVICFQILSLYVVSKSMYSAVAKYGITGSFPVIMYRFRELHLFSEYNVQLSSLASNMRLISIAVSYIWIYIVCNNFIAKKKNSNFFLMLISFLLGIANCIILGARGEAIQLIVATYIIFCLLQRKYNNWKANIKFKQLLVIATIAIILMASFKTIGDVLGRNSVVNYNVSAVDELAKYLGAEIANLDIYLNTSNRWKSNFPGAQTFGNILIWLGNKVGLSWNIETLLPFQKVNDISLGNVYTTFYAYICDFGYIGNIVMVAFLAVCAQITYEYVVVHKKKEIISFNLIVNSYLSFLIAFSFFGERFFSYVINISFIKYLIIWKLMIGYISKVNFRKNTVIKESE